MPGGTPAGLEVQSWLRLCPRGKESLLHPFQPSFYPRAFPQKSRFSTTLVLTALPCLRLGPDPWVLIRYCWSLNRVFFTRLTLRSVGVDPARKAQGQRFFFLSGPAF